LIFYDSQTSHAGTGVKIIHGDLVVTAVQVGVCICDVENGAISPGELFGGGGRLFTAVTGSFSDSGLARTVDLVGIDKAKAKEQQARITQIAPMSLEGPKGAIGSMWFD
jgi:hypothetical protein